MASSCHDTKHTWTNWRKANFEFFKKRLDCLNTNLTLLDLGSGPEQFREITWRFKEVISVDFQQYGTTKVVTDVTKGIPIEDKTVDIVFLSNALEHLPDGQFILRECFRILREGEGLIIGTVPFIAPEHQSPYDYHRYTHYMLEILLKNVGFQDIEIIAIGKPAKVYINMMDEFFRRLRGQKVSNNNIVQQIFFRSIHLIRLINLALFVIFSPLYNLAEENYKFCQGFGFVGYKRSTETIGKKIIV
jgi:SAM-dependent methyltransferase